MVTNSVLNKEMSESTIESAPTQPPLSVEDICVMLDNAEELVSHWYDHGLGVRRLHRSTNGTVIFSDAYFRGDGALQQDRFVIDVDGVPTHKWARSGTGLVTDNPGQVYPVTSAEADSTNIKIAKLLDI